MSWINKCSAVGFPQGFCLQLDRKCEAKVLICSGGAQGSGVTAEESFRALFVCLLEPKHWTHRGKLKQSLVDNWSVNPQIHIKSTRAAAVTFCWKVSVCVCFNVTVVTWFFTRRADTCGSWDIIEYWVQIQCYPTTCFHLHSHLFGNFECWNKASVKFQDEFFNSNISKL